MSQTSTLCQDGWIRAFFKTVVELWLVGCGLCFCCVLASFVQLDRGRQIHCFQDIPQPNFIQMLIDLVGEIMGRSNSPPSPE